MRRMFSQEQLELIIKYMSYTKEEVDQIIESVIGNILLQASIVNNTLYLFAPKMYILNNKLHIDANNVDIVENTLMLY